MIPFIFSSLAIAAVGRAAMAMVNEVRRQFREIPGIMDYTGKPEYEKCVEISTKASIREMIAPGAIALLVPVLVGFAFGPEVLGGVLAGVTVSGVLMGLFQSNAGGAWDNAKKSFEKGVMINGEMSYKGSEAHKAAVTGDTVGDPFKDTSGPSMNILIKLMSIVSLVIAPHIAGIGANGMNSASNGNAKMEHCAKGGDCKDMSKCSSTACPYEANAKASCCAEGAAKMDCCADKAKCEGMTKEECIKMTGKDCSADGAKKDCCASHKATETAKPM
jgi:hypothetical protein